MIPAVLVITIADFSDGLTYSEYNFATHWLSGEKTICKCGSFVAAGVRVDLGVLVCLIIGLMLGINMGVEIEDLDAMVSGVVILSFPTPRDCIIVAVRSELASILIEHP